MIHRFVDVLETPLVPDIPILAEDSGYCIWQIGNLATPRPVDSTRESFSSGSYLSDPEASPILSAGIPTEFVYGWVGAGTGGTANEIRLVDWADTTSTVIATTPNGHVFPVTGRLGSSTSPYPSWHPDGSKIVFVRPDFLSSDPTIGQKIKTVDRDGTNETQLFEATTAIAPSTGNNDFVIFNPLYNRDGTKIAFVVSNDVSGGRDWILCVIDDDGSNLVVLHQATHPSTLDKSVAWANTDDTILFVEHVGSGFTADYKMQSIQPDGTGLSTVLLVDHATYGSGDFDTGPIKWSWLSDDSAIAVALVHAAADTQELNLVDPSGGGATATGIFTADRSNTRLRPVATGGRIYFPSYPMGSTPITRVDSVLEDLTDQRTDLDGTDFSPTTEFDGFKGDNLTI